MSPSTFPEPPASKRTSGPELPEKKIAIPGAGHRTRPVGAADRRPRAACTFTPTMFGQPPRRSGSLPIRSPETTSPVPFAIRIPVPPAKSLITRPLTVKWAVELEPVRVLAR